MCPNSTCIRQPVVAKQKDAGFSPSDHSKDAQADKYRTGVPVQVERTLASTATLILLLRDAATHLIGSSGDSERAMPPPHGLGYCTWIRENEMVLGWGTDAVFARRECCSRRL